jgi:hypothetical protein
MINAELIASVLSRVGEYLQVLPEAELRKLLSENSSIELRAVRNRPVRPEELLSNFNPAEVSKCLDGFTERNAAGNFLRDVAKNKKNLELVARNLDIAMSRQDKAEDILEKIVESTVGARLRSAAIRGDQL